MRESGNHTFFLTAKSSYSEIQNIIGKVPCISKPDKFHLNISYRILKYKAVGVEILMNQSLVHASWVRLIVNPSSLLAGGYCPTELFSTSKKIPLMKKELRRIMDECGIEKRLKEFKMSRFDATWNLVCTSEKDLRDSLDLLRKSYVMPRYQVTVSGCHEWTICCKSSEFSAYNKTYELKERHNIKTEAQILRLELRLGRKRVCQITRSSCWERQLAELCDNVDKQMDKFLHRLYQDCGDVVTLAEALERIEHSSFHSEIKTKMTKLVKLADRGDSLNRVQDKMKLKSKEFKRLLDRFYILKINPITQDSQDKLKWSPCQDQN